MLYSEILSSHHFSQPAAPLSLEEAAFRKWYRFRRIVLLAVVVLLMLLPQAVRGEQQSMAFGQGVLWKVERPGIFPSYVFGTLHTNDRRVLNLPTAVLDAFLKARSLSLELLFDWQTQDEMTSLVAFEGGLTLDEITGPELYSDILEVFEPYGITLRQTRSLSPWGAMFVLGRSPANLKDPTAGDPFLDQWLYREAVRLNKAVYGLETVAEQIEAFDSLPKERQMRLLRGLVKQKRRGEAPTPEGHETALRLYLARDVEGILHHADTQRALHPALAEALADRLLAQRNRHLAARMAPRLTEGNAFIAVGTGHLPGAEGVLNLLLRQGYRITRIY